MSGERRRISDKVERDVRGIIGLMSVVGLFGIVFMQLWRNSVIAIPPEVAGVVGSVVGFYFGSKGASGSEQQAQQSVQLGEIKELVNGSKHALERKLESAQGEIEEMKRLKEE